MMQVCFGILFTFVAFSKGQQCIVTTIDEVPDKPCIFPWKFRGVEYKGCTSDFDPDFKFWCSTKVDPTTREHVLGEGEWGFCPDPNCGQEALESPSELGTWKPEEEKGECGTDLIGSSIVGGVNAKAGEFPYMALLGAKKRYNGEDIVQFLCGGSVINKWYILTAAHCIKAGKRVSLHINNIVIRLGEHDILSDPDPLGPVIVRGATEIKMHENWRGSRGKLADDIALIRVDQKIPLDGLVVPICLPWKQTIDLQDSSLTLSGWGRTSETQKVQIQGNVAAAKNVLQKVQVQARTDGQCEQTYGDVFNSTRQICAGSDQAKDSCQGDSGGPLAWRDYYGGWYQVGIVSFGKGCAREGVPAVYTRLTAYMDWIENNIY